MKDFGRWLSEATLAPPQPKAEFDLPDGVFNRDWEFYAKCRACERSYMLPIDLCDFTQEGNYCGGGPGCTP